MNKRLIIIPILTMISAFFANQAVAVVPVVDNVGKPANSSCKPTVTAVGAPSLTQPVLHFDKIIFTLIGPLQAAQTLDQASLDKIPRFTELDIKVVDNPKTVADLKGKVLSFLGAVSHPEFYQSIQIINVEYAVVVCPK